VILVDCLVCVPFDEGDNGVRSGGMLQVGERGRQTLESKECRTSSGGRVLWTSKSTGINLQSRM